MRTTTGQTRTGKETVVLTIAAFALVVASFLPAPGGLARSLARRSQSPGAAPLASPLLGRRLEGSFYSNALGRTMPYLVYLPAGYDADSERRYPVLYMLHGLSGTNEEWEWYDIFGQAGRLIASGELQPFIIVLPQGDDSYWFDHVDGARWGAYTAVDVVGEIDSVFRTEPDAAHRAVGGLSMGADGALQLALNYPNVFGIAGAHSPTLRTAATAPPIYGDAAYFARFDPVSLAATHPFVAASLRLWLDSGRNDEWLASTVAFDRQLAAEGVPYQWHEYPGGHDAGYWTAHTPDYLRFYGAAFAQARAEP